MAREKKADATGSLGKPKEKASPKAKMAAIPKMNIREFELVLVGDSPLVSHAWSKKAKQMMLDKQMKRPKAAKEAKNPAQDVIASLYWMSPKPKTADLDALKTGKFGFPTIAFKAAAVDACSYVDGITKVAARGSFHIEAELLPIEGQPRQREDMVRIAMGRADIRYRGEFPVDVENGVTWRVRVPIRYNASVISEAQITHLFAVAGFSVGIGEHRPQHNGSWGMFHVEQDS